MWKEANDSALAGKPADIAETRKRARAVLMVAAQAYDAAHGSPSAVKPEQAVAWMDIFSQIGRPKDAAGMARVAYSKAGWDCYNAAVLLFGDAVDGGDFVRALEVLRSMPFTEGSRLVGFFDEGQRSRLFSAAKVHPNQVDAIYALMLQRIAREEPETLPDAATWKMVAYAAVKSHRYAAWYASGKKDQALKALKVFRKEAAKTVAKKNFPSPVEQVDDVLKALEPSDAASPLVNRAAPALTTDRSIGKFGGLAGLRGKVVILDFMAHWCGPCKQAIPGIATLAKKYPADLQVLSVTRFYGYYGDKRDLKPDQEFDFMKDFVKGFKMDWPVLFDSGEKTFGAYKVGAIPQMVVIDRAGTVRKVEVGYEPMTFMNTTQLVDRLVKEPSR